jgi:hypothetical protein
MLIVDHQQHGWKFLDGRDAALRQGCSLCAMGFAAVICRAGIRTWLTVMCTGVAMSEA